MIDHNALEQMPVRRNPVSLIQLATLLLSLAVIAGTYLIATSDIGATEKTTGLIALVAAYFVTCILIYRGQSRRRRRTDVINSAKTEKSVEEALNELDEASDIFTGSLRAADAMRLVSSKVSEVVSFRTIVLFLLNETRSKLIGVHADGYRAESQIGVEHEISDGLAGQAFTTTQVEIDNYMTLDDEQEFGSSVAVPLRHGKNVFGVIQLYFDDSFEVSPDHNGLFESIGSRVAPLILGSIAYERTQVNALTDATTDLPNERAFYLLLENQVAEAQRSRGERPLTILALDIKGFDEINCTFGHAAGDRVLNFVAQVVKDNLRQMDLVARALNDEFLVILPTADEIVAQDVMARIDAGFAARKLPINETQDIEVKLNIGWSAFGIDGETPGQLMSFAQLRKEQMKSVTPNNVLWFPREVREAVH